MNASEMKDQMNEVLIKMSQVMAKQNEFEKEFCTKAEFGSTSVDEKESANNTGVKLSNACQSAITTESINENYKPSVETSANFDQEGLRSSELRDDFHAKKGLQLKKLSSLVQELKSTIDYLYQTIYNQELKLDSLEQYSRSNFVILHGCETNLKQMTDRQVETYVLDVSNNHLDLPCEIDEYELDICHPLPSFKKKNPIIFKFVRRSIQKLVFYHKKNLKFVKVAKLSITESLTIRRLKLLEEARSVFKFKNVWTTKGEVFVNFRGKKHHIFDFHDIEKIRFQVQS